MKIAAQQVLLCYILFILIVPLFAIDKTNFSGEWTFNKNKRTFGDGADRFVPIKLLISHTDSLMIMQRIYQLEYKDDLVDTLIFTLDGQENFSTFGKSPRVISAWWADDGRALTIQTNITFNRDGDESQMISTDIWTLMNKNDEISRDFTIDGPWGEMKAIYVFSRIVSLGENSKAKGAL